MPNLASLLVAALCAVPALSAAPQRSAAEEPKAVQAFKRAFSSKKPATIAKRTLALTALASFDSEKVAKALVGAHLAVDTELAQIEAERYEALTTYARVQKGREFAKSLPQPIFDQIKTLKKTLQDNRVALDELRELQQDLRSQVGALTDADAVAWLVKKVLPSKKHSLLLKLAVSRLAGKLSDRVLDEFERVFAKAKAPTLLVALLQGLSFAGPDAARLAPKVLPLLEHKEVPVRENAAYALAKMAVPEAIEPLINMLEREEGRTEDHVASSLQMLTRQKHGKLVESWRRWFADEKERLLEGEAPLGGGMFEVGTKVTDRGYYFDIAMDGKSILYIIDSSGSMKEEIKLKIKGGKKGEDGKAKKPQLQSRLEACKGELRGALGKLHSKAQFNIMWYSEIPHLFSDKMVDADKNQVKAGREFVTGLQPNSNTNIYDSLKLAFDLAGQGAKDKYYGVGLDTIFLLTDGSPTKPDGQMDSTEKIIEAVRDWNALKRITIHTIGIGKGVNAGFLETLASENNGEFKQY